MVNIPIELFATFLGLSVALGIFGFIRQPQIPALMVFGGLFIITISVATDNIQFGYSETEKTIDTQALTEHYNVNASSAQTAIGGTTLIIGEFVSNSSSELYLNTIDCITVMLNEALGQTATGFSTVGVFYNDTTTLRKEFGTIDNTLLLNNIRQSFTFCLPEGETYQIQELDNVGVFFNDASSGVSEVNVVSDGNLFDGTITYRRGITDTGFADAVNNDLSAIMYLRGFELETNTIEPNLFAFTELHKTLFVLIGVIFMLSGALMVIRNQ